MNEFEKYTDLSEFMQEYASFGHFSNWQKFTEAVNGALLKAAEQPSPQWVPLVSRLVELCPLHIAPYNLGDMSEVHSIIVKLATLLPPKTPNP